jgi:FtsP/CotA-like multicopper oxidase with cupredoxin domain
VARDGVGRVRLLEPRDLVLAARELLGGESFTFRFQAKDPGVYMYHCGTKPVLAHIANGMYGATVVDPATPLPTADYEYVLVASEWYLTNDGVSEPASLDMNNESGARTRAFGCQAVTSLCQAGERPCGRSRSVRLLLHAIRADRPAADAYERVPR